MSTTVSKPPQPMPARLTNPGEIKAPVQKAQTKWRKDMISGARECDFTTMRFMVQGSGNVDDILTIEIDNHNGHGASRLTVRGGCEALEIPGQLHWIADVLAQHKGDTRWWANREYVTYDKSDV